MFDSTVLPGWNYYWKSAQLGPLDDAVIDAMIEHSSRIRSPLRTYSVTYHLGGAVGDVAEDATAYSNRDAAHLININGVWLPGEPFANCGDHLWRGEFFAALDTHYTGAYVNFLDHDEEARVGDRLRRRQIPSSSGHQIPPRPRQRIPAQPQHQATGEREIGSKRRGGRR